MSNFTGSDVSLQPSLDIKDNKHVRPILAIDSGLPSEALPSNFDVSQLSNSYKTNNQDFSTTVPAPDFQPLAPQQQQSVLPQPNSFSDRTGSVSRSISIDKVRRSTSELETLLTDMKVLRKTSNSRSQPVFATTTALRTSDLTSTAAPIEKPWTARISYTSMASYECASNVDTNTSGPPMFSLPVRPLASKRQSQTSQQFQPHNLDADKSVQSFDTMDVIRVSNDGPAENNLDSSMLPITPVKTNFSFPQQHQRNQIDLSPPTSSHTLSEAILTIVNKNSHSKTLVNSNYSSADEENSMLNLVPPTNQLVTSMALETQVTGSSVDSYNEGYYTPAEENNTMTNTSTIVTQFEGYNTPECGFSPLVTSASQSLTNVKVDETASVSYPADAANADALTVTSFNTGTIQGEDPSTKPTPPTPELSQRRSTTIPLNLSPSTVIANRAYDKLQREKRKASAVSAMSAESTTLVSKATAANVGEKAVTRSVSINSKHMRKVSSPLLSQMPLPALSIYSVDSVRASVTSDSSSLVDDGTKTSHKHESKDFSVASLHSQVHNNHTSRYDNGASDNKSNYDNNDLDASKWTAVVSSGRESANSKKSTLNTETLSTHNKSSHKGARHSYPESQPSKHNHHHHRHHDSSDSSYYTSHRSSHPKSSRRVNCDKMAATSIKSDSKKPRKKIPFTNESIQQLLQDQDNIRNPSYHYRKFSSNIIPGPANGDRNNDELDELELPPAERLLIDKFVTALARLSTEMTDDEHKRPEGMRRLHNALKAIEGWI